MLEALFSGRTAVEHMQSNGAVSNSDTGIPLTSLIWRIDRICDGIWRAVRVT